MKKFIREFRKFIAVILCFCLVIAGMPPVRAENYLAVPGDNELDSSMISRGLTTTPAGKFLDTFWSGAALRGDRINGIVPEIDARSEREREKILRSFDAIRNLKAPVRNTFVISMYKEQRRLLPKGKYNPFGEDALRKKIRQLQELHRINHYFEWRLILVDDGSPTEDCYECAQDLWEEIQKEEALPPDRVVIERIAPADKQGRKGGAVLRGIRKALETGWADYIGYTDVDTSIDMRLTGNLLDALLNKNTDAAIGSRWCRGADRHGMPLHARLTSRGFDWLTRMYLPSLRGITDTQRGFKLFDKKLLAQIEPDMIERGFAFDVEMLLLAKRAGFDVREVPISWFESRKASTLNLLSDAVGMFKSLRRFRRHISLRKAAAVLVWDEDRGVLLTQRSHPRQNRGERWEAGITTALNDRDMVPGDGYERAAVRGLEDQLGITVKPENLTLIGTRGTCVVKNGRKKRDMMGTLYILTLPKGTRINNKLDFCKLPIMSIFVPINACHSRKVQSGIHIKGLDPRQQHSGMTGYLQKSSNKVIKVKKYIWEKDFPALVGVYRKDVKNSANGKTFFSPQLEHLSRDQNSFDEVCAAMGIDEISRAVDRIQVDERIQRYETIKPEIKKFLRQFVDIKTDEGKKILTKLKDLRVYNKEKFHKKRKNKEIVMGSLFLAAAVSSVLYPVIAGIPLTFLLGLSAFVTCIIAGLYYYFGITNHISQKSKYSYHDFSKKNNITLRNNWNFDDLMHEFGHALSSLNILDLEDRVGCLGEVLAQMMYFPGNEAAINRCNFEIWNMQSGWSREHIKEHIIDEQLKKEDEYFRINGRYKNDDVKSSNYLSAVLLCALFPKYQDSFDGREAFKFIIELFREMKIRRQARKIKIFTRHVRMDDIISLRHNIPCLLNQFINPETEDGKKIIDNLKWIRIGFSDSFAKAEKKMFADVAKLQSILLIVCGFISVLINGYAFIAYLPACAVGIVFFSVFYVMHDRLFYIKANTVPLRGLGEYMFSRLFSGKHKIKKPYFTEAFAGLWAWGELRSREGYEDGCEQGRLLSKKSKFYARRHLVEFILERAHSENYLGAYCAGVICAIYPDDYKKRFEFLSAVMREVDAKILKKKAGKSIYRNITGKILRKNPPAALRMAL